MSTNHIFEISTRLLRIHITTLLFSQFIVYFLFVILFFLFPILFSCDLKTNLLCIICCDTLIFLNWFLYVYTTANKQTVLVLYSDISGLYLLVFLFCHLFVIFFSVIFFISSWLRFKVSCTNNLSKGSYKLLLFLSCILWQTYSTIFFI